MTEETTGRYSGKLVVVGLLAIIVIAAGIWVYIESQMPILDRADGKRLAASYEKECQKTLPAEKCKERAGAKHAECMLKSASKDGSGEIQYDFETYQTCVDSAGDIRVGASFGVDKP